MSDTSTSSTQKEPVVHPPGIIAPGASNVNVLRVIAPSWIEIELVGEDGSPIPDESYHVILPDGTVKEGQLDEAGLAHIEITRSGTCQVSFPNLDTEAWVKL